MYRIGRDYKIQLKNGIVYTAKIISEDDLQIEIKTIRDEEIILNKSEIRQSKVIKGDPHA